MLCICPRNPVFDLPDSPVVVLVTKYPPEGSAVAVLLPPNAHLHISAFPQLHISRFTHFPIAAFQHYLHICTHFRILVIHSKAPTSALSPQYSKQQNPSLVFGKTAKLASLMEFQLASDIFQAYD